MNNITKAAKTLSKLIDDSEKIALPLFAAKLAKASALYPEDQTLGAMADVTARMANNKKLFISRAEIRDLYNRLYSRNSKFSDLFRDELGQIAKASDPTIYNREGNDEDLTLLDKAYEKIVDPTLANALHGAFGTVVRGYTDSAAESAKNVCTRQCVALKVASNVEVSSGNTDFIICRVGFETPKGQTSVLVPVELFAGKALIPSIFIGNNGPEEFSKVNLQNYIAAHAGEKLKTNESVVFDAVQSLKSGDIAKISNVDLAVTKMNSAKETKAEYFANGVYFQKVAAEDKNLVVDTPTYKDEQTESFAKAFDTPVGIAKFKFGAEKINQGRAIISGKLSNFGLNNHQISLSDSDDNQLIYAVSLNGGRVAFKVPVKISNNKLLEPTVLLSNGALEAFSKEGISALFTVEATDFKVAAIASPLYSLKASELVQAVREAVLDQNYTKAEDALNVLAQVDDTKAYQTAFSIYTNGLNGKKAAKEDHKCSMIVTSPSSKHALCGHTGLPLHKVYQDKNGDCHPAYRKGMDETYEGAYFLNSKIFF